MMTFLTKFSNSSKASSTTIAWVPALMMFSFVAERSERVIATVESSSEG